MLPSSCSRHPLPFPVVSRLRSAELKHGRLAMLAALGLVTPELVQKPTGFEGFHFAPEFSELNAIKALSSVPKLGIAQIVLVIAFTEIATFGKVYNEKFAYEDNLTPLERQKVLSGRLGDLSGAAKTQARAGVNAFGEATDVGFQDPEAKVRATYTLREFKPQFLIGPTIFSWSFVLVLMSVPVCCSCCS